MFFWPIHLHGEYYWVTMPSCYKSRKTYLYKTLNHRNYTVTTNIRSCYVLHTQIAHEKHQQLLMIIIYLLIYYEYTIRLTNQNTVHVAKCYILILPAVVALCTIVLSDIFSFHALCTCCAVLN